MIALLFLLLELPLPPVPLEPGTWWVYRESYTEHIGPVASTTDETTRFEVRGSARRPFVNQTGGADPTSGGAEWGAGWLRIDPWTGEDPLPLPLVVGSTGPASEAGGAWTVEAEEDVAVPAGTYRALRCAFRTRRQVSILWIVPGVGIVRESHGRPERRPEIERVLLRWGRRN